MVPIAGHIGARAGNPRLDALLQLLRSSRHCPKGSDRPPPLY
jgi:hypothetical protein